MKKERESFFNKTLKEIGDEVLDKLVGLLVRPEKPERVDRLTFAGLTSRATLLAEKYPNGKDCKCIICKDSEGGYFNVGLWVIDSNQKVVLDQSGMAQQIMEVQSLDDKTYGFLKNGVCANFILEINN